MSISECAVLFCWKVVEYQRKRDCHMHIRAVGGPHVLSPALVFTGFTKKCVLFWLNPWVYHMCIVDCEPGLLSTRISKANLAPRMVPCGHSGLALSVMICHDEGKLEPLRMAQKHSRAAPLCQSILSVQAAAGRNPRPWSGVFQRNPKGPKGPWHCKWSRKNREIE